MKSGSRRKLAMHRGTTLIEMIVVLAVSSAVFGIAGSLFYTLLTGRGDGRQALERQMDQSRLAEQFRRDVHAADTGEAAAEEVSTLKLTLHGERTVEYRYENERLLRREKQGDQLVRQESYRLDRATEVRFEVEQAGEASFVRFVCTEEAAPRGMSSAGTSATSSRELLALVGRDRPRPIAIASSAPQVPSEPATEPGAEP